MFEIIDAAYDGLSGTLAKIKIKISIQNTVHVGTLLFDNDGAESQIEDDFVPALPEDIKQNFFKNLWESDLIKIEMAFLSACTELEQVLNQGGA